MSQVAQRPAQVIDIDALAAGCGIAAVGQQAYLQPVERRFFFTIALRATLVSHFIPVLTGRSEYPHVLS